MGEHKVLLINVWQKEQKALVAARYALCECYYGLQDEVRRVELLRKGAESIMREETRETLTRAMVMEI